MILLIKIVLAHLIGDFVLQPNSWVVEKEDKKLKSPRLYLHVLIHTALILLLTWELRYWLLALSVGMVHFLIDVLKLYAQKDKNKTRWFLIDQLLHFVSIVVLWVLFFDPGFDFFNFLAIPQFWLYLTAILFLTTVCGILMQIVLSNWTDEFASEKGKSLLNAGKYIGILERVLVFAFVVSGHWEAIGFLVAAKSVLRFGDLKDANDRKLTEYILIGTLLSFGIAIVVGLIVLASQNSV